MRTPVVCSTVATASGAPPQAKAELSLLRVCGTWVPSADRWAGIVT